MLLGMTCTAAIVHVGSVGSGIRGSGWIKSSELRGAAGKMNRVILRGENSTIFKIFITWLLYL